MNKRLLLVTVLAIMATLSSTAVGQDHGPPAGGSDKNLKDSTSDVKGRSNEIERVKRDIDKSEASEKAAKSTPPNFSQIKEDFERIQIINSDVLQVKLSSGAPNYDRISEAAAEIEMRATRLNSNLFPPKSGKQSKANKSVVEDQELKALLVELDKAVDSFTHSPIFQNIKVVNPQDTMDAQKELEKVIKTSARIKLEAGRLKKSNSPPQ